MTERGQAMVTTKADVMEWVETQLAQSELVSEEDKQRAREKMLRLEEDAKQRHVAGDP